MMQRTHDEIMLSILVYNSLIELGNDLCILKKLLSTLLCGMIKFL
jgi:hypothetical protein